MMSQMPIRLFDKFLIDLLRLHEELGIDTIINEDISNTSESLINPEQGNMDIDKLYTEVSSNRGNVVMSQTSTKPLSKSLPTRSQQSTISVNPEASDSRKLADNCNTLEDIYQAIRDFEGCSHLKKTAKNTVIYRGNPQARIMLIGEAPGADEDTQGIPFCGRSGKLLDKMLNAIGLDENTVYISNSIFWRPPGNRRPTDEETSLCLPLTEKHIALINPEIIVFVGGTAYNAIISDSTAISKVRGKFSFYSNKYTSSEILYTSIFHPSYLLRQPAQKKIAWLDLQAIERKLQDIST